MCPASEMMKISTTSKTLGERLLSIVMFAGTIFTLSTLVSEETSARDAPGWGNSALVCGSPRVGNDSPDLSFRGSKNAFETGFYFIGRLPDPANRFLGVVRDGTVRLIPADVQSPFSWLVTGVGAGLYQISICYKGQPRCLVMSDHRKMVLSKCEHEAYGNQAWWNVGILFGAGKGGWELGNDGLGRMDCLTEDPEHGVPYLAPCDPSGKPSATWRFEPEKIIQDGPHAVIPMPPKAEMSPARSPFPEGADVITYQCDSGQRVKALYDSDNDVMKVRYQDEFLVLHPVISGSGAKFGGINKPWGWWTKADQGSIFSYNANGTEGEFIENCKETGADQEIPYTSNQIPKPTIDSNRNWLNSGAYEEIVLMDCADCGDDIGMMIRCNGAANQPLVSLHRAATENPSPASFLTIEVDGQVFKRDVSTVNYGMLGQVPEFYLQRNDPLVVALQKGTVAKINYGGEITLISLRGSKSGFEIFNAHCGWNNHVENTPLVSKPDPVASSEPPITDQDNPDGAIWYTSEYFDDQKKIMVKDLIFGIPETDAIALIASCDVASTTARLDLLLDIGDLQTSAPYSVRLQTGVFDQTYNGNVFFDNSEYSGVRLSMPLSDQLWGALAAGEAFYIQPQIGSERQLKHSASVDAVGVWLDQCKNYKFN